VPDFLSCKTGDTARMAANGDNIVLEMPPGDDDYVPGVQPPFVQPPQVNIPAGHVPLQQQFGQQQQPWWVPPWVQQQWLPPPPQWAAPQHVAQPHKVKLTNFWTNKPDIWFTHAEALFATYHVVEELMKYHLVLPTLSGDTLTRVAAVVNNPHVLPTPYSTLKARLLEVYRPDTWELTSQILHYRELGDLKPSQLMDELLALLPTGEHPGLLFKTVFLNRLPEDVRAHVQGGAKEQDCRELAAAADVIWQARNQRKASVLAAVPSTPIEDLSEAVAAVKLQQKAGSGRNDARRGGGGRGRGRGANKNRPPAQSAAKNTYVCFRHAKFGDAAWECEDPTRCTAATTLSGN